MNFGRETRDQSGEDGWEKEGVEEDLAIVRCLDILLCQFKMVYIDADFWSTHTFQQNIMAEL